MNCAVWCDNASNNIEVICKFNSHKQGRYRYQVNRRDSELGKNLIIS